MYKLIGTLRRVGFDKSSVRVQVFAKTERKRAEKFIECAILDIDRVDRVKEKKTIKSSKD